MRFHLNFCLRFRLKNFYYSLPYSPLRVHGALTSRNCVVDARWVLKITDYGLPAFYDAQGLSTPSKSAKGKLKLPSTIFETLQNFDDCSLSNIENLLLTLKD